jgi:hypothetical protein
MVDVYSLAALTTARKETAARIARNSHEKPKTRAAQASATREQAAADAEVDPLPDKPFRPPVIVASVDVAPLRGRRWWALGQASATDVSTAASLPYVLLGGAVQAATYEAAAAPHPTAAAKPQRQTVGTAPGDAGPRAEPLPYTSAAVPTATQAPASKNVI